MSKYSIVSPRTAAKALAKRQASVRRTSNLITLDPIFPLQNSFVSDPARYLTAQCSRRAGKTNGLCLRFLKTMETHPKSQSVYLALTRDSARDIMWPVLHEMNDKYRIGLDLVESRLTATHPNGAKLILLGADMSNFIKRLKGRKYPAVAIDEAQDFSQHLQSLVDDVLTPSIADYADGWLALTGTPGPVPTGYFYEVTQERKYGYSYHEWTILDNPYMPNPAAFIEDMKLKRGWDDRHPTLLREWRNQWVLDQQSLWIVYDEKLNHYQQLPQGPAQPTYVLGIDIGFKDADALAVIAWYPDSPVTYLVEEVINRKQGLTELVEQIQALEKKYRISKMVIDEGGLGKKLAEEMRRRYGIPVHAADKARKQENVDLLNDSLRLGKFMAKGASQFAQDSYRVQIDWDKSTPNKIIIKKKPHSDVIDAVLYAFKESPAYTFTPEAPKPRWGTKEWAEAQPNEMWEAAQVHFEEVREEERRASGQWD